MFDIRVVLGATESSQPVTSRRKTKRNLSRVLSSNGVKIDGGAVDITVVYKEQGSQDKVCTTPLKKTIYSNAETEIIETLNADKIGERQFTLRLYPTFPRATRF